MLFWSLRSNSVTLWWWKCQKLGPDITPGKKPHSTWEFDARSKRLKDVSLCLMSISFFLLYSFPSSSRGHQWEWAQWCCSHYARVCSICGFGSFRYLQVQKVKYPGLHFNEADSNESDIVHSGHSHTPIIKKINLYILLLKSNS